MMIINQHYNHYVITRRQQWRYNNNILSIRRRLIPQQVTVISIIVTIIIFPLIARQSLIVITATETTPTIINGIPSVHTRQRQRRQRRQIPCSFLLPHHRHTSTNTLTRPPRRKPSPLATPNHNDNNPPFSSSPLTILHNQHHHHQQQQSSKNNNNNNNIIETTTTTTPLTITGPFTAQLFSSTNCWGRRPLLIKNAFDPVEARRIKGWPTKEEVLSLVVDNEEDEDEDGEDYSYEDDYDESCDVASRLISHHPNSTPSHTLSFGPFGPFGPSTLSPFLHPTTPTPLSHHTATLLINDIDRHLPPVSTWMDSHFSFLPRWRRDDGQISLTTQNGGIGPHVDHYDVFLIQVEGSREWRVGRRAVSVAEEHERTVPDMDVRILENENEEEVVSFELRPGDCLYVPPRFRHDGIALEDDCMTLSVGCRAPSVGEMMVLMAEEMMEGESSGRYGGGEEGKSSWRYRDISLLDGWGGKKSNEITKEAKNEVKALMKRALSEILDDDDEWDKWFGTFVSEPKRSRMSLSLRRGNDDVVVARDLSRFCRGLISLYQTEGLIFAFTRWENDDDIGRERRGQRLFVDGEIMWEDSNLTTTTTTTSDDDDESPLIVPVDVIANERRLTRQMLLCPITGDIPKETKGLLKMLLMKGFLRAG